MRWHKAANADQVDTFDLCHTAVEAEAKAAAAPLPKRDVTGAEKAREGADSADRNDSGTGPVGRERSPNRTRLMSDCLGTPCRVPLAALDLATPKLRFVLREEGGQGRGGLGKCFGFTMLFQGTECKVAFVSVHSIRGRL